MKQRNNSPSLAAVSMISIICLLAAGCSADDGEEQSFDLGKPVQGTVKPDALSDVKMSFVSFGGAFQDGQQEAFVDPFAQESGAEVVQDGPTALAKLQAQVESGQVTWDVLDIDVGSAQRYCGELFMELDFSKIDTSNLLEGSTGECHVPHITYGNVLAYNDASFQGKVPPRDWSDFFDTKKFPGKRAVLGQPTDPSALTVPALLASGVPPEDVFKSLADPEKVDQAFEVLDGARDSFVFWTTGAEAEQLLTSGEVDMAIIWNGIGATAERNGAEFTPVWEAGFAANFDVLTIAKGSRNADAAHALLNFSLGAEQQAKISEVTSYDPVNLKAKPDLDPIAERWLTTADGHVEYAIPNDPGLYIESYDELGQRYAEWLSGG